MTTVSNPIVNFNKQPKGVPVENTPHKVLVIGQMIAGTATAGDLVSEISNDGSERALFGDKSHVAGEIARFKKYNKYTRVDAIALDNSGGTAATGVVTFTGVTATESGTIDIYVGEKDRKYSVAVSIGDDPVDAGDALVSLITADTTAQFTAANVSGVVTLTASNKGPVGNTIGLTFEQEDASDTITTLTAFTGGATVPSLTGIFDVIGDVRYQTILWPQSFDTTELKTLLQTRWNYENKILDGVGVVSYQDTVSSLKAIALTENHQSIWVIGDATVDTTSYKGAAIFTQPDLKTAEFCALRALRLTDDTDLSLYSVGTTNALDLRGGVGIAAKPYHETPMYGLPITAPGVGFTDIEVSELKDAGVIVLGNNKADSQVVMGTVVTTYLKDGGGNPDPTYHFGNAVDTFSNVAEYFFNNSKRDYAQYRLTSGETLTGRNIANEKTIRGSFVQYYTDLSRPEYALTQAGDNAINYFSQNLVVNLNLTEGKVVSFADTPLVSQLREIDGVLYALFDF